MSSVFYRNPKQQYPRSVRGDGVYVVDDAGKRYLDACGGAAVCCLGHAHPVVIDAIKAQVDQLAYAHTAYFTNEPQEQLAAKLVDRFGEPDARAYFLSGGSEANEATIKLCRQYWLAKGRDDKRIIVSRKQSYHGNSLGALSLSDHAGRRKLYEPLLLDWPRIDPCYAYRCQTDTESEEEYGSRSANALEEAIAEHGADNIAAFIAETVVGATLGAVPPVDGYFQKIRKICDRHDILLILDEVMAGSGRTGTYFSFEQDGIKPDITTIAKGLAGGYQPISAMIVRGFVHDTIIEEFGSFEHGHTYVGHATACAAALAVSNVIDEDDLLSNVRKVGKHLVTELESAFAEHPNVGDIRGRGLLVGIELVADRASKAPANPAIAGRIKQIAMDNGLMVYPSGGTADGQAGAHILLAPPFIYDFNNVDELVSKLQVVLGQDELW